MCANVHFLPLLESRSLASCTRPCSAAGSWWSIDHPVGPKAHCDRGWKKMDAIKKIWQMWNWCWSHCKLGEGINNMLCLRHKYFKGWTISKQWKWGNRQKHIKTQKCVLLNTVNNVLCLHNVCSGEILIRTNKCVTWTLSLPLYISLCFSYSYSLSVHQLPEKPQTSSTVALMVAGLILHTSQNWIPCDVIGRDDLDVLADAFITAAKKCL